MVTAHQEARSMSSPMLRGIYLDAYSKTDSPYKHRLSPISTINSEVTRSHKISGVCGVNRKTGKCDTLVKIRCVTESKNSEGKGCGKIPKRVYLYLTIVIFIVLVDSLSPVDVGILAEPRNSLCLCFSLCVDIFFCAIFLEAVLPIT